ncbi:MAG: peptide chain release factor-like protein [Planctomycetaceae bacterium]
MTQSPEPVAHPGCASDDELLAHCAVERIRRSGPGGQHRNKVETGIRLRHRPTDLTAQATERRSQAENLKSAIDRLRWELVLSIRQTGETDSSGAAPAASPLWKSRCPGGMIKVNPQHRDYPLLVAEALDVLARYGWDMKPAAEQLGCTASQLTRFLRDDPRVFAHVNAQRKSAQRRILH